MPSKATQKCLLSEKLSRTLVVVTDSDCKERKRTTSEPDGELLKVLFDACIEHFDGDEEQAICALRRHLVIRHGWLTEQIDQELEQAGVLRTVNAAAQ